jgi:hypothetical protein
MKQAPLQTKEDFQYVKDYLLLPVILDVLERDIKTLDSLQLKMPDIYIRALKRIQDQVTTDLSEIRKVLRARGMKVYEQSRTKTGIEASYLCRGYQHSFAMLWVNVRSEVKLKLSKHMNIDLTDGGVTT